MHTGLKIQIAIKGKQKDKLSNFNIINEQITKTNLLNYFIDYWILFKYAQSGGWSRARDNISLNLFFYYYFYYNLVTMALGCTDYN